MLVWCACMGFEPMKLDHIMFAAPSLDTGQDFVENLTGVKAAFGGSHPGAGTCNALLSFGSDHYLEIIAPDTAQELSGTFGAELAMLSEPFVRTWAVAADDYDDLVETIASFGFRHRLIEMERTRPDGVHLAWQILFVTDHPHGLAMPFFINWQQSPHPALTAPAGCQLEAFTVQCPGADQFQSFCSAIALDVIITTGNLNLTADLITPNGEVRLG
mgnify:CR=1 FL=1